MILTGCGVEDLKELLARGLTRQAREEATTRAAANPHDTEAWVTLAKLDVVEGRIPEALDALLKAEAQGRTVDSLLVRANLLVGQGNRSGACALFEEAVQKDEGRPEPHYGLGMALASDGKIEEARSHLSRAAALAPRSAVFRHAHASALAAAGDETGALQELRAAEELAPNYLPPYLLSARLLAPKQPAEAIAVLRRGLKANPNQPNLAAALASLEPQSAPADSLPLAEIVGRIIHWHERQLEVLRSDETATPAQQLIAALRARAVARDGLFGLTGKEPAGFLPKVKAPEVPSITWSVPRTELVAERWVQERLSNLQRRGSPFRIRGTGEAVQRGDDVLLDFLTYVNGKLVPFSVRSDFQTELYPDKFSPGIFEAIVGTAVGARTDFRSPGARPGEEIDLVIVAKAARELKLEDVASAAFLERIKRGNTLEALRDSLRAELRAELDAEARLQATHRILDTLAEALSGTTVSNAQLDALLEAMWRQMEGNALQAYGAKPDVVERSRQSWLTTSPLRSEVERRIRIAAAVEALAADKAHAPTDAHVQALLRAVQPSLTVSVEEARKHVERSPFRLAEYQRLVRYLATVESLTERANITFVPAN